MREISSGLWHWDAPHPDWEPSEPWGPAVSSYAIDDGERLLLFDPIAPPSELIERAAERDSAIVLTCPWHERDTRRLVERLGSPVYAPPPDTAEDLMRKYGVTAEQAGDGSPDLAWLRTDDSTEWHAYEGGDRLPAGAEAFPGRAHNDMMLWIPSHGTVISGDTLVDFGDGLEINEEWLRAGVTQAQVVEGLRPLFDRPVEHVLATHGGPTDHTALKRALSDEG
jgi:glyoxylase-like metal-dependent hydrolase (beta-lactamase superfamily II)